MVRDSAMVTIESLQETAIALSNGTITDPYTDLFPQNGVPKCTHHVLISGEFDRRAMSPFAKSNYFGPCYPELRETIMHRAILYQISSEITERSESIIHVCVTTETQINVIDFDKQMIRNINDIVLHRDSENRDPLYFCNNFFKCWSI